MSGSQSNQFSSSGGNGLSSQHILLREADQKDEAINKKKENSRLLLYNIYLEDHLYISLWPKVLLSPR